MNGIHDMGGMHGMGPIDREADEPYFHENWEKRVFGLFFVNFVAGHFTTVEQFRHAIERMAPAEYLTTPYYEHWLHSFETLLIENGIITPEELAHKQAELSQAGGA